MAVAQAAQRHDAHAGLAGAPAQPDWLSDRFKALDKVGEGTYGSVYKVLDKQTEEIYALKKIKMNIEDNEGVPSTALREISVLLSLDHPNIVKLVNVDTRPTKLVLVFEFIEYDLRKVLDSRRTPLPEEQVVRIAHQVVLGLDHCHKNRIVHRDVKPQNILISQDLLVAKLADFGLSRALTLPILTNTHEVITLWYRPPEILLGQSRYTTSVDVWSMGCVLYEMGMRQPIFPGDSEVDTLFKIFRLLGTPVEETWPGVKFLRDYSTQFPRWPRQGLFAECSPEQHCNFGELGPYGRDLLIRMLEYDPQKRMQMGQALGHSFFNPTRFQNVAAAAPVQFGRQAVPCAP
eukprot:TRINITY_DN743_c5_g2_i1.p1 TRINITY_DN743_c5_g2~~TRINITY_DN743_c5_g2_i1.p1  ORF type:complete len:380 (+),score=88.99 TRINITY_DN743_c5_g2_i1:101-1141(+)